MTTPLVEYLRQREGVDQVIVICKPASYPIFSHLGGGVQVFTLPKRLSEWIRLVRKLLAFRKSACLMLAHSSTKGLAIGKLLGIDTAGYSEVVLPVFGGPRYKTPVRSVSNLHIADQILALSQLLGMQPEAPDRRLVPNSLLTIGKRIDGLPENYVVVHPGSRWMFKSPREGFWTDLLGLMIRCGFKVVVTGEVGGTEGLLIKRLCDSTGAINLAGATNICSLAKVIKEAKGFVGVDTFASHVASAVGVPGVVLFGPTSGLNWGPYGQGSKMVLIENENFSCRPCLRDGCNGSKVSDCLDTLSPEKVFSQFNSILTCV